MALGKISIYASYNYIPPINSTFTLRTGIDKDIFENLEKNIEIWNAKGEIIIMGDLNAHISQNERDYIYLDSTDQSINSLPNAYIADTTPQYRNLSIKQTTNNYGKQIIDLCITAQLRILNGRTLGDTKGRATFFNTRGVSIVDYCICSASLLSNVLSFVVEDFCVLSDHCPITVTIQSLQYVQNDMELHAIQSCKWSKKIEEKFIDTIQKQNFEQIRADVTVILKGDSDIDIKQKLNHVVDNFSQTLRVAAGNNNNHKTARVKKKR